MSSNYASRRTAGEVREAVISPSGYAYGDPDEAPRREVRCNICKGSGLEIVQGQETDCMECEGYGTVLV